MKLAFVGDTSFHNIQKYTSSPFREIIDLLSELNLVVNLESAFLPNNYVNNPVKNKICLKQNENDAYHLKKLNPFLINLSNNHINDYGNFGAKNTQKILGSADIPYFGAGFSNEDHNVFVCEKGKIVFLSYATRSCDLTGSKLFNEEYFIGPKEFTFELLKHQVRNYQDYVKIVLFHWGLEQKHYPLPEQRIIAKKMVDEMGIVLIIGNHPHVVQGFERYNNKYIFYSLGNFLFPDVKFKTKSKKYYSIQQIANRISIVPVFEITGKSLELSKIFTTKSDSKFELCFVNKNICRYNVFLLKNDSAYAIFYKCYSITKKFGYAINLPLKLIKRIVFYRNV